MRTQSDKVARIENDLRARLATAQDSDGARFFSSNTIASRYGISYRTAFGLLKKLQNEGLIVRRIGAGSYFPGTAPPSRVRFVFSVTSRNVNNAHNYTLDFLVEGLRESGIETHVTYATLWRGGAKDEYFVFYGDVSDLRVYLPRVKHALHINNTSNIAPGVIPQLDIVSTDHLHAGRLAGNFCLKKLGQDARVAFFRGPTAEMYRKNLHEGFCEAYPNTPIFAESQKYMTYGPEAEGLARERMDGVFCSNVNMVGHLRKACSALKIPIPKTIAFDNYKFSEKSNLTAVASPYREVAATALDIIRRRMNGEAGRPIHITLKAKLIERDF